MSERELCGFLVRPESWAAYWRPCYDPKQLLEAEPERVSFALDQQQLHAELLQQYPDLEPDYGRVDLSAQGVIVSSAPHYRGAAHDLERITALARQYGQIQHTLSFANPQLLWDHGCLVQGKLVRYAPREVQRYQRQEQRRAQTQLVGIHHVRALYGGLLAALPSLWDDQGMPRQDVPASELALACVRGLLARGGRVSLEEELRDLLGLLTIVTALLGKGKLRQLPCLRQFRRDWTRNQARNQAKFAPVRYAPALLARLGLASKPQPVEA